MSTRREKIEAMLAAEPGDPFLRYSLALEQQKQGEHAASLDGLTSLMNDAPAYVPAFLMAAQQLVSLSRTGEARDILRRGIDEARRQNEAHAAAEMAELLTQLGRLGE